MEINYEDWDGMLKQIERTVKADAMSMAINQMVLKYVTKERNKCPTPVTSQASDSKEK